MVLSMPFWMLLGNKVDFFQRAFLLPSFLLSANEAETQRKFFYAVLDNDVRV
jgi:hypothetical protein